MFGNLIDCHFNEGNVSSDRPPNYVSDHTWMKKNKPHGP
jgi:hypothetical protein